MGQAKQRGTYEQRKALGEARREKVRQELIAEFHRREAAMTPLEKAQRHRQRMALAAYLGVALADPVLAVTPIISGTSPADLELAMAAAGDRQIPLIVTP